MTTEPRDDTTRLLPPEEGMSPGAQTAEQLQIRSVLGADWRAMLRLTPMLLVSLSFHVGLVLVIFLGTLLWGWIYPAKPMVEDKTIEVSMVVLPHTDNALPDKAMRAPRPAGKDTPTAVPDPAVKQSELEYQTDKAKADAKGDPNADKTREKLLADLQRKQLLEDLSAPTGEYDQDATDPNSTSNLAINTGVAGAASDPEYAKYIMQLQQLFMQHFRPLPGIGASNPKIKATVFIEVDDTGKVLHYAFKTPSGNASYDAAAESAVQSVPTIPLPPEKYRALAKQGYEINFTPPR
jgi:hypothetical protein